MSIRLRLAVIFALATAVTAAVFGYVIVTELAGAMRSTVVEELSLQTSTLLQQLPSTGISSRKAVRPTLRTVAGSTNLTLPDTTALTQLVDDAGHVVAASGPASNKQIVSSNDIRRARSDPLTFGAYVGRRHMHFLLRVTPVDGGGFVVAGQSLAALDLAVSRMELAIAITGCLAVVLAWIGAWLLATLSLRPVERMRRQAESLSEERDRVELDVPRSRDEIARLAVTLNSFLSRLHASFERERGFSAAASHELRSPLALVRTELELAARAGRSREYLLEALHRATAGIDRIVGLADLLLLVSQGDENALHLEMVRVELRQLTDEALHAIAPTLARAGVEASVTAQGPVLATVDPVGYRRIVENLVENAAIHGGAHHVALTLLRGLDSVTLEVEDDGAGFPEDFLPHAFDRFSRADPSRSRSTGGAGLGLAIVASLAHAHGGTASASNTTTGGALVSVAVPYAPPVPSDAAVRHGLAPGT